MGDLLWTLQYAIYMRHDMVSNHHHAPKRLVAFPCQNKTCCAGRITPDITLPNMRAQADDIEGQPMSEMRALVLLSIAAHR